MKRIGRNIALFLAVGSLVVLLATPAFGQEEEDSTSGGGSTTETEDSGLTPAIEVVDEPGSEAIPDWTYRYMIPLGLVLAAVVILLTSIQYFTNVVRKRYRIVEE